MTLALKLGCLMSINPDAHSTRELDLTHWGVEMARKGGVPKDRVLNCLSRDELASYLEKRRDRSGSSSFRFRTGSPGCGLPSAVRKAGRSAQASEGHQPLIFQALLPHTRQILTTYLSTPHHSHRERIASASAVSICSVYRVW